MQREDNGALYGAPLRDGDVWQRVAHAFAVDMERMYRMGQAYPDDTYTEAWITNQIMAGIARKTTKDAAGNDLYFDVTTSKMDALESYEDRMTLQMKYLLRGTAVYRLPRRSDRVELALDLHAYDRGSSFYGAAGETLVLLDAEDAHFATELGGGHLTTVSLHVHKFPMEPIWQPRSDMTPGSIFAAGYSNGIPARARVAIEDSITPVLEDGAL